MCPSPSLKSSEYLSEKKSDSEKSRLGVTESSARYCRIYCRRLLDGVNRGACELSHGLATVDATAPLEAQHLVACESV